MCEKRNSVTPQSPCAHCGRPGLSVDADGRPCCAEHSCTCKQASAELSLDAQIEQLADEHNQEQ